MADEADHAPLLARVGSVQAEAGLRSADSFVASRPAGAGGARHRHEFRSGTVGLVRPALFAPDRGGSPCRSGGPLALALAVVNARKIAREHCTDRVATITGNYVPI